MIDRTNFGCEMLNGRQWKAEDSLKVEISGFFVILCLFGGPV